MTGRSRKKAGMNDVLLQNTAKFVVSIPFQKASPPPITLSYPINVDGMGPMGAGDKISKNSATQSNSGALM